MHEPLRAQRIKGISCILALSMRSLGSMHICSFVNRCIFRNKSSESLKKMRHMYEGGLDLDSKTHGKLVTVKEVHVYKDHEDYEVVFIIHIHHMAVHITQTKRHYAFAVAHVYAIVIEEKGRGCEGHRIDLKPCI